MNRQPLASRDLSVEHATCAIPVLMPAPAVQLMQWKVGAPMRSGMSTSGIPYLMQQLFASRRSTVGRGVTLRASLVGLWLLATGCATTNQRSGGLAAETQAQAAVATSVAPAQPLAAPLMCEAYRPYGSSIVERNLAEDDVPGGAVPAMSLSIGNGGQ